MKRILKNIRICNLSLIIDDCLVVSDVHLGYRENLIDSGIFILDNNYLINDMIISMAKKSGVSQIILNGDIKHFFHKIGKYEWRDVLGLFRDLKKDYKLRIIKGNHDNMLMPIVKKENLLLEEYIIVGDTIIMHGDKEIEIKDKKIKNIVIGHVHPSLFLKELNKEEKYKCFLKGKFKSRNLIVMPSLNYYSEGVNIFSEDLLSPYLKKGIDNFKVYISNIDDDSVFDFGKIKDIRNRFN
jgi:uncharacterized protein